MAGWKLLTHSIRMVFWDLKASLRISGLLYAAIMVAQYFVLKSEIALATIGNTGVVPSIGLILLSVIVSLVASLWIAVAWHRYVLEDENNGAILPAFHSDKLLSYFGVSLLIGVIIIIPTLLLIAVVSLLLFPMIDVSGPNSLHLMSLILSLALIPVLYAFNRLSAALPAVAVGKDLSFKQAWAATGNFSGAIWHLSILEMVAYAGLTAVGGVVFPETLTSLMLQSLVFGWIGTMVGVSILTTIYGVAIEGRELP